MSLGDPNENVEPLDQPNAESKSPSPAFLDLDPGKNCIGADGYILTFHLAREVVSERAELDCAVEGRTDERNAPVPTSVNTRAYETPNDPH